MPVHSGIRTHIAIVIPGAGLAELFEHAPSLEH